LAFDQAKRAWVTVPARRPARRSHAKSVPTRRPGDGNSGGACYDGHVRVRAGATIIVALIAVTFARARADSASAPDGCSDAKSCAHALYHTVATKKPRAELSRFLVAAAQRAAKARDWGKAIPLYQALVVARGAASPESKELATLWTLAGQNE